MEDHAQYESDSALLAAIRTFVAGNADPALDPFRDGIAAPAEDWQPVPAEHRPVADLLEPALAQAIPRTRPLVAAFAAHAASRKWEQSYTAAMGVVGADMLAGYGFAEVIGKWGPFVSAQVRAGIGIWGPQIAYPAHRHGPEEVYVPLAGAAEFTLGDAPPAWRGPGEAVHVPPMLTHGVRTGGEPFVVFYIWQAGDLRETSRFD